ncbi:MAG: bifunctional precorrin-2 dehydrogenase/sirohydrochlorin ferrochelatase [Suilimivivens sp.]
MAYFPLFVSLDGYPCLVIGGGKVALRKIRTLQEYGAKVTVVSPEICQEIEEMTGVKLIRRKFKEEDLTERKLVFAASSDEECNTEAARLCREKGILINVADEAEKCDFFFPALVKRGDVTVGISTGGKSPAVASKVRKKIDKLLPEDLGSFTEEIGKRRKEIKDRGDSTEGNEEYLKLIEDYFEGERKYDDD